MNKIKPQNIFHKKPKFVFIHIPKNAGSSIQKWIHATRCPNIDIDINWDGNAISNSHQTALNYKQKLGIQYNDFFTFAFVRNPWDRMFSFYNWTVKYENNKLNFETWLNKNLNKWTMKSQSSYIENEKDEIIVDFIGKYENLYNDLKFISSKINIKLPDNMFHENATNHINYKNAYNDNTIEIINKYFIKDILQFGYTYE